MIALAVQIKSEMEDFAVWLGNCTVSENGLGRRYRGKGGKDNCPGTVKIERVQKDCSSFVEQAKIYLKKHA